MNAPLEAAIRAAAEEMEARSRSFFRIYGATMQASHFAEFMRTYLAAPLAEIERDARRWKLVLPIINPSLVADIIKQEAKESDHAS